MLIGKMRSGEKAVCSFDVQVSVRCESGCWVRSRRSMYEFTTTCGDVTQRRWQPWDERSGKYHDRS